MNTRKLGKTNVTVSALGFGTMRLPIKGSEAEVDEPLAIEMLRRAIDRGVNYVDTAYPYHAGNSEFVVGKALADGYREKVHLATKLPTWLVNAPEDFDRFLDEQLSRLRTQHVEFYFLHCLQKHVWLKMRDLGVLDWAQRAQADGRIGRLGFSFHDGFEAFKEIVDAYDWSFCQIQYNYVNEEVQAGTRGLKYAAEKGLGVIVMEPLFGGALANRPDPVRAVWDAVGPEYAPVDLALQWLWNKPEVSLVLSGMSTMEQVEQNLASASRSGVGSLGEHALGLIARVQHEYQQLSAIPCTRCRYCMPCPQGVDIPVNFELYNNATLFKGSPTALCKNLYMFLPASQRASACVQCGACEARCPQQIAIPEKLQAVQKQFG